MRVQWPNLLLVREDVSAGDDTDVARRLCCRTVVLCSRNLVVALLLDTSRVYHIYFIFTFRLHYCAGGGVLRHYRDVVARQQCRDLNRLAREAHAHDNQLLRGEPGCLRRHGDVTLYLGTSGRRPNTRLAIGRFLLQIQRLCTG